jgi:hypothetical protein
MIVFPEVKWVDKKGTERNGFYMDKIIVEVCEAAVDRVLNRKQDILFIFSGSEGSGKSNAAVQMGAMMAKLSGRTFGEGNIFFKLKDMMTFAANTTEQIIIWDEAALGGLAADWSNESQKKLKSMLMICRKLRHIFIFNVPRFYRLSPDVIERAYTLLYLFEDEEETPGNFIIIGREGLENLYNEWRRTRQAKYFNHNHIDPGHFDWHLPHLINEELYEENKTRAIKELVNSTSFAKASKWKGKYLELKVKIYNYLNASGVEKENIAKLLGNSKETLKEYSKSGRVGFNYYIPPKDRIIDGKDEEEEEEKE